MNFIAQMEKWKQTKNENKNEQQQQQQQTTSARTEQREN